VPGLRHVHVEHDVPERLGQVLHQAGFRVAVLRASVPALKREQWYEKQIKDRVEVVLDTPNWSRPVSIFFGSDDLLLRNRLFATHLETGFAQVLAYRPEIRCPREVPDL